MPPTPSPTPEQRINLANRLAFQRIRTRLQNLLPVDGGDVDVIIAVLRERRADPDASPHLGQLVVNAFDDSEDPWAEVARIAIHNMQEGAWLDVLNDLRLELGLPHVKPLLKPLPIAGIAC